MRRLPLAVLVGLCLLPALLRARPPSAPRRCDAEGRGSSPRHWLGCAADPGAPRGLVGDERLLLGLPLDPNRASARELAFVPGLTAALAAELVAERHRSGPFGATEEVLRVRGIGPKRLARARPYLEVAAARLGVAGDSE